MTTKESILISAYTNHMLCKDFSEIHKLIEETLSRPIMTHELADKEVIKEIRVKLLPQVIAMIDGITD